MSVNVINELGILISLLMSVWRLLSCLAPCDNVNTRCHKLCNQVYVIHRFCFEWNLCKRKFANTYDHPEKKRSKGTCRNLASVVILHEHYTYWNHSHCLKSLKKCVTYWQISPSGFIIWLLLYICLRTSFRRCGHIIKLFEHSTLTHVVFFKLWHNSPKYMIISTVINNKS